VPCPAPAAFGRHLLGSRKSGRAPCAWLPELGDARQQPGSGHEVGPPIRLERPAARHFTGVVGVNAERLHAVAERVAQLLDLRPAQAESLAGRYESPRAAQALELADASDAVRTVPGDDRGPHLGQDAGVEIQVDVRQIHAARVEKSVHLQTVPQGVNVADVEQERDDAAAGGPADREPPDELEVEGRLLVLFHQPRGEFRGFVEVWLVDVWVVPP
jgi:hypothetical protein